MLFQYIESVHNKQQRIIREYNQIRSKRKLKARNPNGLRVVFQSIAATVKIWPQHLESHT